MDKRVEILKDVEEIITKSRVDIHGKPENSFPEMAKLWSIYIGKEITASDVCVMMTLFKVVRLKCNPEHKDNVRDAIGYLACAYEMIENNKG